MSIALYLHLNGSFLPSSYRCVEKLENGVEISSQPDVLSTTYCVGSAKPAKSSEEG